MEILRLEVIGKRIKQVIVHVGSAEGEAAWATLDPETIVRERLGRGQRLDGDRQAEVLATDRAVRARKAAAGWLARGPRTEQEVRLYLARRGFDGRAAAAAIDTLRASGTLDNDRAAERMIRARRRRADMGPQRLAAELRGRGLGSRETAGHLARALEGVDLAAECRALAGRLAPRYAPLDDPRQRAKLAQALARRGYESEHVRAAVEAAGGGNLE